MYFHITGSTETTWFQNHSSNFGLPAGRFNRRRVIFDYEYNPDRQYVDEVFVAESNIYLDLDDGMAVFNRLTGEAGVEYVVGGYQRAFNGHCSTGFKEYENNLF